MYSSVQWILQRNDNKKHYIGRDNNNDTLIISLELVGLALFVAIDKAKSAQSSRNTKGDLRDLGNVKSWSQVFGWKFDL